MKPIFFISALLLAAISILVSACGPKVEAESSETSDAELFAISDFEVAKQTAKASGKVLVVDFMADWCPPCKMMDRTTWKDPALLAVIAEKAVPMKVDVDANSELAAKYGIEMLPTIVVLDSDGKVLKQAIGFQDANKMIKLIEGASS